PLELEPKLLKEDVFVHLLRERIHRYRVGRQVERSGDEVAVFDELVLDIAVAQHFYSGRPWRDLVGQIESKPRFALLVVGAGDVEVRQSIETWIDLVQQLALDDRLVGGRE